jgi:hypothetical protein
MRVYIYISIDARTRALNTTIATDVGLFFPKINFKEYR